MSDNGTKILAFDKAELTSLVDTKYAEYWEKTYGYSYSDPMNKKKQEALLGLAWRDLYQIIERLYINTEPVLSVAKAGTHNVDGRYVSVSNEDREAFCAMRPYICKTGSSRDEIIALLQAGGSLIADEDAAPEKSSDSDSTTTDPKDISPEVEATPSTKTVDPTKTPPQPEPSSDPTHKVAAGGSRLAFRDKPASVSVSEKASEDTQKKGKLIKMLSDGKKFIVIDEGLGHECEWDYIKVGDKLGYIYNKLTSRLSETPASLEIDCSSPVGLSGLPFKKDWVKQEIGKPYYDDITGKYCVPVETEYDSTGGSELKTRMKAAISDGLILILKNQAKSVEDEEVERILGAFIGPRAEEYYVDPRPNTKMRVLVSFDKKYIGPLPAGAPEEEKVEVEVVGESPAADLEKITLHKIDYDERKMIAKTIVVNTNTNPKYEETIDAAAAVLELYAKEIDRFDGTVEDVDLRKEADRLKQIPAKMNSFLSQNGVSTAEMDQVEFGLDSNNKIIFVSENSQGYFKKLNSGFDSFVDQTPLDSPRTMNYFYYMWEIEAARKEGLNWTDFLGYYTIDPVPTVYPSKSKENSANDISGASNDENSSTSGNTTADKVDEEITGIAGDIEGAIADGVDCWKEKLNDASEDINSKLKQSKTALDNMAEKAMLAAPDLRDKILSEAKSAKDFVGDQVVADMSNTLDKIKNLDEVFAAVLNKITLGDLVAAALSCLEMPTLSVDLDLDFPWPPEIPCFDLPKIPTIDFPDSLPTMDIMSDLSTSIFEAIIDALTQAFVEMLKELIEELLSICDGSDDDTEGVDQNSNLSDMIDEAAASGATSGGDIAPRVDDAKLGVLQGIGALDGRNPRTLSDDERSAHLKNINDLLNDISLILSTRELCRLLKGKASQKTLALVRSLVRRRHPHMYKYLGTKTKLANFFIYVGRLTGSKMCDLLADLPDPSRKPQLKRQGCVDPFAPDVDFEGRLRDKGGDITEEQVAELVEKARERRKAKMNKLAAIADLVARHQKGEAVFEELIPDILCGPDGQTSDGKPPLIKLEHDSKDFMEDIVVETMFTGVYTAFNRDIEGAINAMIRKENEEIAIPITVDMVGEDGDTTKVTNPEIQRMEAQGIDMDTILDSATMVDGVPSVTTKQQVRMVSPIVRNLLREMETNGSFYPRLDSEGIYYELQLPPDAETMAGFEALNEGLAAMKGMMGDSAMLEGFPDFDYSVDFEKIRAVMPDWRIRYKVPYQLEDKDIGQEVDDDYIVEIFSVDDVANPYPELAREYLRTEAEGTISDPVKAYINAMGMTTEATTPISFTIAKDTIPLVYGSYEFNVDNPLATGDVNYLVVHVDTDAELGVEYYQTYEMTDENGDPCEDTDSATPVGEIEAVDSSDISRLLLDPSAELAQEFLLQEDPCPILKVIKTYYEEDNEKYSVIWEMVKEEYYQCVLEGGDEYDTFLAPPPHAVFGRYVSRLWTDEIKDTIDSGEFLSTRLDNFGEKTENFFSTYVHPQAAKDLFSLIARQISNSQLFGSQTLKISVPGMNQTSYNPYITKMTFVREPTPLEQACDIDPHMLMINCFKKEVKEKLKENSCPTKDLTNMKTDGSPRDEPSTWEAEMLHVLVKMTFRAYIIDYTLRGIFPISEFLVEETIDPYLLDFLMKKMLSEMEAYGGNYSVEFQDWSNKVYNSMLHAGTIEPEAVVGSDTNEISEDEYGDDAAMDNIFDSPASMRALMRHFLMLVYIEIQDIIDRDLPGIRSSAKNPHEYLIEDWLPVIDLPESISPWSTRFSRLEPELSTLAQISTISLKAAAVTDPLELLTEGPISYSTDFEAELEETTIDGQSVAYIAKSTQSTGDILQALSRSGESIVTIDGEEVDAVSVLEEYEYKNINDLMGTNESVQQGLNLLTSFTENGEPFDLENGNFFLERFYKITTKSFSEILNSISSAPVTYIDSNDKEIETTLGQYLSGQTSDESAADGDFWTNLDIDPNSQNGWGLFAYHFNRIWDSYFSGETPGSELVVESSFQDGNVETPDSASASEPGVPYYVNVKVFNEIMPAFIGELKEALNLGSSNNSAALWENGVVDLRDLEGTDVSGALWRASNFFEEVSPGLRLIYIPPVSDSQFNEDTAAAGLGTSFYGTTAPSNEQFYGQEETFAAALATLSGTTNAAVESDAIAVALSKIRDRQKAFTIKEDLERERASDASRSVSVDGVSGNENGYAFTSEAFTREIYPIPLIDSTRVDGSGETWWFEFSESNTIFDMGNLNYEQEHDLNIELMKQDLLSSTEFNLLFNFVFPLNRYFSMLNVFTIMAMSAQPNRESAFDGTKDELWKLWKMLTGGGGYKQDSVSNEELARLLDGFGGGWSTPCFSFAFNLTPPKFKGIGLDIIPKLAIKTPPLIFKAVVELVDPNIHISKMILDLSAIIGLCIPIPAISIGLLPPTIFGFPPFGIGIGPLLTPLGFIYLALGFELGATIQFTDEEESKKQDPDIDPECQDLDACREKRLEEVKEKIKSQKGQL